MSSISCVIVLPVISAASASIRLRPSRPARPLGAPLCGVTGTRRPRASRTSEFGSVDADEKHNRHRTDASLIRGPLWRKHIVKAKNEPEEALLPWLLMSGVVRGQHVRSRGVLKLSLLPPASPRPSSPQTVRRGADGQQFLRESRGSVRRVRRRPQRGGALPVAVHHERRVGGGAAQDQERGGLHDQHLPRHAEVRGVHRLESSLRGEGIDLEVKTEVCRGLFSDRWGFECFVSVLCCCSLNDNKKREREMMLCHQV